MTRSPALGAARLLLYGLVTVLGIPLQALALALRLPAAGRIPLAYHRLCCRIIGIDIDVRGRPGGARPTLFVANHVSYLDIMVLGALIPGSFVAKSEVSGWPLFGLLARLQRTVFVERAARHAAAHRDRLGERLAAGDPLILFPEGTSTDGSRTLRFKSTLFAALERLPGGATVPVQPVSVTCTALDGMPIGRHRRSFYAWYGDMDLTPHLWQMVGLGRLTVAVEFHDPLTLAEVGSRKALAERCRQAVAGGVERANAGQPRPAARAA